MAQSGPMRAVSWNAQHGVPDPKGPPDLGKALAPLAAMAPDVVGLQEVDTGFQRTAFEDQVAAVADSLGGTAFPVPAFRRGEGTYGNALVVRGEIVEGEVMKLPGSAEPRAAGVARLRLGDGQWSVAVTHLSLERTTALDQLGAVLDALEVLPRPRLLLGDLNLQPPDVGPVASTRGYKVVEGPPTWNARSTLRRRLDHMLLKGAEVQSSGAKKLPVSDHLAIWADLQRTDP